LFVKNAISSWVKDAKKVTEVANNADLKEKMEDADYIEFPTFHQYVKTMESIDDEKFKELASGGFLVCQALNSTG
jgi:hypothetical protein